MPMHFSFFKFLTVLFTSFFLSISLPANAQENTVPLTEELAPLMDRAKELGLNVIIVGPEKKEEVVEDTGPSMTDQALVTADILKSRHSTFCNSSNAQQGQP